MKKITAIVQARIGSSRLRGKVLKKIKGKEVILILLERLSKARLVNNIIMAIPDTKENDILNKFLIKNNYTVFRGSEKNVLRRYYECAKKFSVKNILRVTGDCPLVDHEVVDEIIQEFYLRIFRYYRFLVKYEKPQLIDGYE